MVLNRRYDEKLKLWYIPPHPLDNLGIRKYIMPNQPMGLVVIKELDIYDLRKKVLRDEN